MLKKKIHEYIVYLCMYINMTFRSRKYAILWIKIALQFILVDQLNLPYSLKGLQLEILYHWFFHDFQLCFSHHTTSSVPIRGTRSGSNLLKLYRKYSYSKLIRTRRGCLMEKKTSWPHQRFPSAFSRSYSTFKTTPRRPGHQGVANSQCPGHRGVEKTGTNVYGQNV